MVDFGIRGIDLTYALLEPYAAAILVDAAPRAARPRHALHHRTRAKRNGRRTPLPDGRSAAPRAGQGAALARSMGGAIEKIFIVGCEPRLLDDDDDFGMAMSPPVRAAVDEAATLIESLVLKLCSATGAEPAIIDRRELS